MRARQPNANFQSHRFLRSVRLRKLANILCTVVEAERFWARPLHELSYKLRRLQPHNRDVFCYERFCQLYKSVSAGKLGCGQEVAKNSGPERNHVTIGHPGALVQYGLS